jgi:serine protease inhibitor
MKPSPAASRLRIMKKQLRAVAALTGSLIVAVVIAGCGLSQAPPVVARGVAIREPAANPRPYGAADAAFGLNVLGAWCRSDPGANLVLSPSSLASGLGMAYLGARGATAQAMATVLHLPASAETSPASAETALQAGLQARSTALRHLEGPGVTLTASDQVWADPSLKTLSSYLNAVATGYDAGVAQAPLLSNPSHAIQVIDAAIAAATHGQIPHLLAPGSLQNIGWVLTDALYMKAAWSTPFDVGETSPEPFTTAAGHHVTAEFMKGGDFAAASAAGWTAVSLPYRGGKLAMVALLPAAGAGNCAMPASAALGAMTTRLAAGTTGLNRIIALPRVNLSTRASMRSLLSRLGMGVAFTSSADFAGLSPQACCIGLVEQAATLQVGEQGTVASAATAVGVQASSAEEPLIPQVVFNRPYLLLVTDSATGEPLFLARVANPAAN